MTNIFRDPPHNLDAEMLVLGAVMMDRKAYERLGGKLKPEHFYLPVHGKVFAACSALLDRGQSAESSKLTQLFMSDPDLEAAGGIEFLAVLAASGTSPVNAGEFGRLIVDLHRCRELIAFGSGVIDRAHAYDVAGDSALLIEQAEAELFELAETGGTESGARRFDVITKSAVQAASDARASEDGILGLKTGLPDFDRALGGLAPSDLIVLGGRPGMGKSALSTTIAYHVARDGVSVGVFSLEMSGEQIAHRLLAVPSGLAQDKISRGRTDDQEWSQVETAASEISNLPIHIDDTAGLAIGQVLARARRMKRRHNVGLIIIDHLSLIRAKAENRTQEITRISASLKVLAKELNVPVLALSQLSRQVEQRDPPRPSLADLRESGSIEQDADIVAFLYREHYYLDRKEPRKKASESREAFTSRLADWNVMVEEVKNDAEVIIAKNRHGRPRNVKLHFDGERTWFGCKAREGAAS